MNQVLESKPTIDGVNRKCRLGIIALHPVQYHAPLYRKISECPFFDAEVIYLDTIGIEKVYDDQFKAAIVWDIPLLNGYKYAFLKNYARHRIQGFLSRINPGIFSALRKGDYDVVFVPGYSQLSCWLALLSAKIIGIKVVWRGEATSRPELQQNSLARRLKNAITRWFLHRCDALMYSCEGNREFLMMHGIPSARQFPFPCAVDNDWFQQQYGTYASNSDKIRAQLGIPNANMVIMYCGPMTRNKRLMDIAKAVNVAGPKGISVVMMGDGEVKEEIEVYAREKQIDLHMLGFIKQSEIAKYYSIADVVLVVSGDDRSPKSLNEAMNFEAVPIVSQGVGTAKDLVIEGETGFVVRIGDVESIAVALDELRNDPERRRAMGRAAKARVSTYSFDADVAGLRRACLSIERSRSE